MKSLLPFRICIGLMFLMLLVRCSKDEEPQIETIVLDESEIVSSKNLAQMVTILNLIGYEELVDYLKYDVSTYKITYKTIYKGQEILASGLVTFPETKDPVPMMSYQHGTIVADHEAPTVDLLTYSALSSIASDGYIFIVPDYIGFGSSSDLLHPYYIADYNASSVIDMMKAAKELAVQKGYNFDGRVFLSGYSEGGYVTMATHKVMEENPIEGFELIASAPASGGFNIKAVQEYLFGLETYSEPFYIAYVVLSYTSVYDWTSPLSLYFQEPYAANIEGYFDGSKESGEINVELTTVLEDYLSPEFIINIDTDTDYADIVNAISDNSTHDWIPKKTMFIYHGTGDVTVPYQNSVDSYNHMIDLGASTNVVDFIPLEGFTHSSGVLPYTYDFLDRFENLK